MAFLFNYFNNTGCHLTLTIVYDIGICYSHFADDKTEEKQHGQGHLGEI